MGGAITWPTNVSERYGKLNKTGKLLHGHMHFRKQPRLLLVDEGVRNSNSGRLYEQEMKLMRTELVRITHLRRSRKR